MGDVDSSRLYTQPEEVWEVYKALSAVPNGMFTVAAAFGNVHGVYAPGNVELKPDILHNTQAYISEKLGGEDKKPTFFVFHGGSGSSRDDAEQEVLRPTYGYARRRGVDARSLVRRCRGSQLHQCARLSPVSFIGQCDMRLERHDVVHA